MKKRILYAISLFAVFLLLFTACKPATPEPTEPPMEEEVVEEPVEQNEGEVSETAEGD